MHNLKQMKEVKYYCTIVIVITLDNNEKLIREAPYADLNGDKKFIKGIHQ